MIAALLALLLAAAPVCAIQRDAKGRIVRNSAEVAAFKRENPAPPECKKERCVVDHVLPLCAGGCDVRANMAWMRAKEAKVKDQLEVAMCRAGMRFK